MSFPRSRVLFPLMLVALLGGCATWQPVGTSAEAVFQDDPPDQVRVTRTDGERLIIRGPQLRAGAIVGTASRGAVLLENIRVLEVRGTSVIRSIGLVLPGVVILAIVAKEACRC
ncbi:MAG: hypothetical protein OEN56_12140 [Gemmatimonadota bacterium]|nr:hypothetical protein [Gemmatimonadota bacterium]